MKRLSVSSWNGIHFRSAYFPSWPSGELYDNLILPVTPGSVKPILILFRVDHRFCRGPRQSRALGCQEWQSSARLWVTAREKIKLQLTKHQITAGLWAPSSAWVLTQLLMALLLPTRPAHCCTNRLEEHHLRCGILNKVNSVALTLTKLQVMCYFLCFSHTLIINTI